MSGCEGRALHIISRISIQEAGVRLELCWVDKAHGWVCQDVLGLHYPHTRAPHPCAHSPSTLPSMHTPSVCSSPPPLSIVSQL